MIVAGISSTGPSCVRNASVLLTVIVHALQTTGPSIVQRGPMAMWADVALETRLLLRRREGNCDACFHQQLRAVVDRATI